MNHDDILQLLVLAARPTLVNQVLSELRREGGAVHAGAVEDEAGLRKALESGRWDVLLCMEDPGGPAPERMLEAWREARRDIPLILLLAEGSAADPLALLRGGACEVLEASGLGRLPFSLLRESRHRRVQRQARHQEAELRELRRRHRLLLETSGDAFCYLRGGAHLYCNPAYAAFFGYPDADGIRTMPLLDLIAPDDRDKLKALLAAPLEEDRDIDVRGRRRDGSLFEMTLGISPVQIEGEACLQLAARPAAGNAAYAREGAEAEQIDLLTRLANARHFRRKLENAIGAALREQRDAALLIVRLDEFPDIETEVGQADANLILADIAAFLRDSVQKPFSAARLSAYEFGLLLHETNPDEALKLADVIRDKIGQHIPPATRPGLELRCSVGLALINDNAGDADSLLLQARAGLDTPLEAQQAFRAGAGPEPRLGELVSYLDQALDQGSFKLLFQPVVNLKGQDSRGFEVFSRLLDSEGNEVPPGAFLPAIRLGGMGEKFDRLVVSRVLDLLGGGDKPGGSVVVNLTGATLASRGFLSWLSGELQQRRSPTDRLGFQISEIDLYRSLDAVLAFCTGLAELNLKRVLKHFGCALEPFRHLQAIAPDYVILDESLLRDIVYSSRRKRELATLIEDLHSMGCLAAAPRVENMDLLPLLWETGVDLVQGYCLQGPSQDMDYEFVQEQEITLAGIQSH